MPPVVLVVEGTNDVTTLCAELMVKMRKSGAFEDVKYVPRTPANPLGFEFERSRALMCEAIHTEFDIDVQRRIETAGNSLFILCNFYDAAGRWRESPDVRPHVVWYVESGAPTQDPRRASFIEFVQGLGLNLQLTQDSELALLNVMNNVMNLRDGPDAARV